MHWNDLPADLQRFLYAFFDVFELFTIMPRLCKSWNSAFFTQSKQNTKVAQLNFRVAQLIYDEAEDRRAALLPEYIRTQIQRVRVDSCELIPIALMNAVDLVPFPVFTNIVYPELRHLSAERLLCTSTLLAIQKTTPDFLFKPDYLSENYYYTEDLQKNLSFIQARKFVVSDSMIHERIEQINMFAENCDLTKFTQLRQLNIKVNRDLDVNAVIKIPDTVEYVQVRHKDGLLLDWTNLYSSLPRRLRSLGFTFPGTISVAFIEELTQIYRELKCLAMNAVVVSSDAKDVIFPSSTANLETITFQIYEKTNFCIPSENSWANVTVVYKRTPDSAEHKRVHWAHVRAMARNVLGNCSKLRCLKCVILEKVPGVLGKQPKWVELLRNEFPKVKIKFLR